MRFYSILFLFSVSFSTAFTQSAVQLFSSKSKPTGAFFQTDSLISVIVTFKGSPLADLPKARRKSVQMNVISRFENDLNALGVRSKRAGGLPYFTTVFHGTALEIPASKQADLQKLLYVARVEPDAEIRASEIVSSASRMSAPEVWSQLGFTGKGVTIGILDSGIDYNHPDLGGGFGPGFKVIAGWNFVDNNGNPMDVFGHGTHVAGIAAANGSTLKGVAPDAKLVAYKVLNDRGNGLTSDILAAMEKALDPNGDGEFSDKLDIINMSLGSQDGLPTDPAALAADRLMQHGVVVIAAAGNSGFADTFPGRENNYLTNGSLTVGAPGSSTLAITVGSIETDGTLASYSSKGPVPVSWVMKPDVVAVGSGVLSAIPGGGSAVKNGTSMAAPAVAGLAALLLEQRPNLRPSDVKSILSSSAKRISAPVHQRGSGEISALSALNSGMIVQPTQVSFGLVAGLAGTFSAKKSVTVRNQSQAAKQYSVQAAGMANLQISTNPTVFSVAPGDSISVDVELTFSRNALVYEEGNVRFYSGSVQFNSITDTLFVPVGVVRGGFTTLAFSKPKPTVLGYGDENYFASWSRSKFNKFYWINDVEALLLAPGRESITLNSLFENEVDMPHVLVERDVFIEGEGDQKFSNHTDAKHVISLGGKDDLGRNLSDYSNHLWQMTLLDGGSWFVVQSKTVSALRISDVAQSTEVYVQQSGVDEQTGTLVTPDFAPRNGISSALTFSNNPADLKTFYVRIETETGETRPPFVVSRSILGRVEEDSFPEYVGMGNLIPVPIQKGNALFTWKTSSTTAGFLSKVAQFNLAYQVSDTRYAFAKEWFGTHVRADGKLATSSPVYKNAGGSVYAAGDTVRLGSSPVYTVMRNFINSFGKNSLQFDPFFRGSHRETSYLPFNSAEYRLLNPDGSIIKQDFLRNGRQVMENLPDQIRLEISYTQKLNDSAQTKTEVVQDIDFTKEKGNAPVLRFFELTGADGKTNDAFKLGDEIRFRLNTSRVNSFEGTDADARVSAVRWRYQTENATWNEVPGTWARNNPEWEGLSFAGFLSEAALMDDVAVDLEIMLQDSLGNRATHRFSPAFTVGNWKENTSNEPGNPVLPNEPALLGAYPNPFNPATKIRIRLAEAGSYSVSVFDITGRKVATISEGSKPAGVHLMEWNARGNASGVFIIRLEAQGKQAFQKVTLVK